MNFVMIKISQSVQYLTGETFSKNYQIISNTNIKASHKFISDDRSVKLNALVA